MADDQQDVVESFAEYIGFAGHDVVETRGNVLKIKGRVNFATIHQRATKNEDYTERGYAVLGIRISFKNGFTTVTLSAYANGFVHHVPAKNVVKSLLIFIGLFTVITVPFVLLFGLQPGAFFVSLGITMVVYAYLPYVLHFFKVRKEYKIPTCGNCVRFSQHDGSNDGTCNFKDDDVTVETPCIFIQLWKDR